jgi:mono/diheme cytochrome c family protein
MTRRTEKRLLNLRKAPCWLFLVMTLVACHGLPSSDRAGAALSLGILPEADPPASTSVQAGKTLALNVCSACHVVSPAEAAQPKLQPPAPSFPDIANRPGTTAESLRAFLLTTHATLKTPPNMPGMLLSDDEATAAANYILSLKTQQ